MTGNEDYHNETGMGSIGHSREAKASVSADGTDIQAEMSNLFRLENRTIVRKDAFQSFKTMALTDFNQ
jgi:hypothetical protein